MHVTQGLERKLNFDWSTISTRIRLVRLKAYTKPQGWPCTLQPRQYYFVHVEKVGLLIIWQIQFLGYGETNISWKLQEWRRRIQLRMCGSRDQGI